MTREQTKEAIAVMQAYVDGKEVQVRVPEGWKRTDFPIWQWTTIEYRIAPTATLRPWTADEVPLGAWMKKVTNREYRWLINTSSLDHSRKEWLQQCEHSTDGGVTWKPCGVVEEAK